MNSNQTKTLVAIFTDPLSHSIKWADIESLFVSIGCTIVEGTGSRVRFRFGNEVEAFHRPHPAKEAMGYQVGTARKFLIRIGITP
jgi:HicA toxin of bacterial toxin-antitoxin,